MDTNVRNTQSAPAMPGAGHTPENMKIDDKAIKKMAGEAIGKVDGVLAVEGNLADMLKPSDDLTKGIGVTMAEDGKSVQISAKLVTEYGKNIPAIVEEVQNAVERTLREMAGLAVEKVEVEITDTMTRAEYQAKTSKTTSPGTSH